MISLHKISSSHSQHFILRYFKMFTFEKTSTSTSKFCLSLFLSEKLESKFKLSDLD